MRTRETYALHLTPVPGHWLTPPLQRLRHALKAFLRAYGLRCTQLRTLNSPTLDPQPVRPSAAQARRHFAQMRQAAEGTQLALTILLIYFLLSTLCFSQTPLALVWCCPKTPPVAFEIWRADLTWTTNAPIWRSNRFYCGWITNISARFTNWSHVATTTNLFWPIPQTTSEALFRVRALDQSGATSPWATTY